METKTKESRGAKKVISFYGFKLSSFLLGAVVSAAIGTWLSPAITKRICFKPQKIVFSGIITNPAKDIITNNTYLLSVAGSNDTGRTNGDGTFILTANVRHLNTECSMCNGLNYFDKIIVYIQQPESGKFCADTLQIPSSAISNDSISGSILTCNFSNQ